MVEAQTNYKAAKKACLDAHLAWNAEMDKYSLSDFADRDAFGLAMVSLPESEIALQALKNETAAKRALFAWGKDAFRIESVRRNWGDKAREDALTAFDLLLDDETAQYVPVSSEDNLIELCLNIRV